MSNPYQPSVPDNPFSQQPPNVFGPPPSNNWVKQIPIVGIVNIIQAFLELLMATLGIGLTALFTAMSNDPKFQEQLNKSGNVSMTMLIGIYVAVGIAMAVVGVTRLIAGIMILRRKGRIFALVASFIGLISVFTCYCSITSIAVCVYTLMVLLSGPVEEEFAKSRPA